MALTSALKELLAATPLTFKSLGKNRIAVFPRAITRKDVSGRIVDAQNGESLPYANISLRHSIGGAPANAEGYFAVRSVRSWPCTLDVHYIGYKPETMILDAEDDVSRLQITLQPGDIKLDEQTIRSANWEAMQVDKAPGQLSISPQQFSDLPMLGNLDVSRSLQLMPGIRNSGYSGSGLHIRSGRPSQNLVLLDGMTLYHTDHSFGFFSAFNAQAIKDVRVFKGGLPARYGGRISGVMELTGRSGDFHKPQLTVSSGLMSAQALAGIPLGGHGALLLSFRKSISGNILGNLHNRIFKTIINDISPLHAGDGVEFVESETSGDIGFYDGLAKLTWAPSQNNFFTFSFFQGRDKVRNIDDSGEVAFLDADSILRTEQDITRQTSRWGSRGFSGQWYRHGEFFQTTVQLTYSDYFTRFNLSQKLFLFFDADSLGSGYMPSISTATNDVTDLSLRLDNTWHPKAGHSLDFGFAYTHSHISLKGHDFYFEDDLLLPEDYSFDDNADLFSFYIDDAWQLSEDLQLTGGLRSNLYVPSNSWSERFTSDWEPRLSIRYQFFPNLDLKASWGRFFQYIMQFENDTPYIDGDISWILADYDFTRPGFSEQLTFGWQYQDEDFLLDVEFYNKRLKGIFAPFDRRQYENTDTLSNPYEQKQGFARGIDVHVRQQFGELATWISYSYSKSRFREKRQYFRTDQDLPHDLKLVGSYDIGAWRLSATWQYMSGRPHSYPGLEVTGEPEEGIELFLLTAPAALNTERLPVVHHLDVSLTHTYKNRYFSGKSGFSLYNVYDQDNIWYRYFTVRNRVIQSVDVKMFGITPSIFLEVSF